MDCDMFDACSIMVLPTGTFISTIIRGDRPGAVAIRSTT